jgi:hypothetical protein
VRKTYKSAHTNQKGRALGGAGHPLVVPQKKPDGNPPPMSTVLIQRSERDLGASIEVLSCWVDSPPQRVRVQKSCEMKSRPPSGHGLPQLVLHLRHKIATC